MHDQLFTADNFRRIFDVENRKGLDVAGRFFPEVAPLTLAVREKVKELRAFRKNTAQLPEAEFQAKVSELKSEIHKRKADKSKFVDELMDLISEKVRKNSFAITLTKKVGPGGKDIFCIDGSPETFFVVKQLQYNLSQIYGVKQANRHDMICRVRDMLSVSFPHHVVRTDIAAFYESIERDSLLRRIEHDQLLGASSKRFLRQILDSYGTLSGKAIGVPRGVGVSAYLAELYLRPLDEAVKEIEGVTLYCRYVDDIIAIFSPPPKSTAASYESEIVRAIKDVGLAHNSAKTKSFVLGGGVRVKFEYLGYRFLVKDKVCELAPSSAKIRKYKKRIDAAFKDYHRTRPICPRSAHRHLVARVKYLTGNFRLINSKSTAVLGVYYTNSLASNTSHFSTLDKRLKRLLGETKRPSLKKRLKENTFKRGFEERRFHNFSPRELRSIVEAWKHG